MVLTEMLIWWYTKGWSVLLQKSKNTFSKITDFFSMDSLVRTLFKPFRQISAGNASQQSSLELKFHMFTDRLISRIIGFFSRIVLLITGILIIIVISVLTVILTILWPILPLMPIAGIIMTAMGVVL